MLVIDRKTISDATSRIRCKLADKYTGNLNTCSFNYLNVLHLKFMPYPWYLSILPRITMVLWALQPTADPPGSVSSSMDIEMPNNSWIHHTFNAIQWVVPMRCHLAAWWPTSRGISVIRSWSASCQTHITAVLVLISSFSYLLLRNTSLSLLKHQQKILMYHVSFDWQGYFLALVMVRTACEDHWRVHDLCNSASPTKKNYQIYMVLSQPIKQLLLLALVCFFFIGLQILASCFRQFCDLQKSGVH